MRLLIVRHGDPDYERDTLTEKGWQEARLLAKRFEGINVDQFYVSPLGRAKDTASLILEQKGTAAVTCDWLQEFPPQIDRPDDPERKRIAWDWLPQDWTADNAYYEQDQWDTTTIMRGGNVGEEYKKVIEAFDELLAQHGYIREGNYYRATQPNRKTLAFFCHFGLECVLLSHLMNLSPMILWHHTCAAPSTVTSLYTEERRQGIAVFRMNYFGDQSHLYAEGEEPSFKARFCETWDAPDERHD